MTTNIYLLRHGRISGPAALYGHTDVPCSPQGLAEVEATCQRLPVLPQIVCSPLKRCWQGAEAIVPKHTEKPKPLASLQEMSFGDWDGVPFDDLGEQWSAVEAFFYHPAENTPPNGESLANFYQRCQSAWRELCELARQGDTLVVAHGGTIRMLLAIVLQLDWRQPQWFQNLKIDYASLTKIQISPNFTQVHYIGLPWNA